MNFIANLLLRLSNATIPLAYILIIFGILCAFLKGIGSIKKMKNNFTLKEITPKVREIEEKYKDEDKQLEELSKLYKEHHFSTIAPQIFTIIGAISYFLILSAVFYSKNFNLDIYTKSAAFFTIENIFERRILIVLPCILAALRIFAEYIFIPKELVDKKTIIINVVSQVIISLILPNIFPPIYCIFLLGSVLMESILKIPYNKLRRDYYYKYPPTPEEIEQAKKAAEQQGPVKKKSFKELYKELEVSLDETTKKK